VSNISTTIKGHENLKKKYQNRSLNIGKVDDKTMTSIVKLIRSSAVNLIRNRTVGKIEARYKDGKKRMVVVSAEGKAPNSDLGLLLKGIIHDVKKVGIGKSIGTVRSKAPYSLDLELGTEKMAKRPFMGPALKGSKKQILAIIAEGVRHAL
jgi:HK97 gp10 family phage protein